MKKLLCIAVPVVALCSCGGDEAAGEFPRRVGVRVVEYAPAPGQFVNLMPKYSEGMDYAAVLSRATEDLAKGYSVTLGALGGYIVLALDEPVYNNVGEPDFRVCGNAYSTGTDAMGRLLTSGEPGLVEVMEDSNGNGLPDDGAWIPLCGEHWAQARRVTVSYVTDTDGAIVANAEGVEPLEVSTGNWYHDQPFTPQWSGAMPWDSFEAVMLPPNGFLDEGGMYRMLAYWGYADSYPDDDTRSALNLDDAATPVRRVDFVRVSTAVLQSNGPLGECSTEVSGLERLH